MTSSSSNRLDIPMSIHDANTYGHMIRAQILLLGRNETVNAYVTTKDTLREESDGKLSITGPASQSELKSIYKQAIDDIVLLLREELRKHY